MHVFSHTLPRKWSSSKKQMSREIYDRPPLQKSSLARSSSFTETFKVPEVPLLTKRSSLWRSKSISDLKWGRKKKNSLVEYSTRTGSQESLVTASILNKNLRSNSWRNLLASHSHDDHFGGMNTQHRLSCGPKKVAPPSVPEIKNPRASISSFGSSENSYYEADSEAVAFAPSRRLSEEPSYLPSSSFSLRKNHQKESKIINNIITEVDSITKMEDLGIDVTLMSPGRGDSPGHDSNASSVTFGSGSSGGCRNSTTSLDSGRASNSESLRPSQNVSCRLSSFRQSYHSSSSDNDGIISFNVGEMIERGLPDHEILLAWLSDLHFEEYYDLFLTAGYDMPTISRMTPEDLTAIGIKKPNHRKRLKMEIGKLRIGDGLPLSIPDSLTEWLHSIRLPEYSQSLMSQGYVSIYDIHQITVEDLEDVGIFRLGHQKRFLLAMQRNKDLLAGRRITNPLHFSTKHNTSTQKCSFSSFMTPRPTSKHGSGQQPMYCPEILRIDPLPPPPPPSTLLSDMPRPMAPLQMFQRANSFGRQRSYDDGDIVRASDESVLIHYNGSGGGGTLPRPKGYVKPRPVAKIIAKTREPSISSEDYELKKPWNSSSSLRGSLESIKSIRQLRNHQYSDVESLPFANEHAGTIRMRSNSNNNEFSNWQFSKDQQQSSQQNQQFSSQQRIVNQLPASGRTAGDVLNDIGCMLADLTDELDAMLHIDRDSKSTSSVS